MTTGLRAGELLALQWTDIDLVAATLHVALGKTINARRTILLPDELVRRLKANRGIGLVFCTKRGTPLSLNNLRFRDFIPTIGRAGLPRVRIHDLRHMHASLLLAAGVPMTSVSERLGHGSKSFTLATYGHVVGDGQRQAATVAGQVLASQLPAQTDMIESRR